MAKQKRKPLQEIGNIPYKKFQEIKSLMNDYEVTEKAIEALKEYSNINYKSWDIMGASDHVYKVRTLIEEIEEEQDTIYNWIELALKGK